MFWVPTNFNVLVLLEGWEGSGVCCPLLELDIGVGWVLFFIFYPFVEIGAEVFSVDSSVCVFFIIGKG